LAPEADVRSIIVSSFLLMAVACGPRATDPSVRTDDACAQYTGCGECVGQPQCGWCITEGQGRCAANAGETSPSEPAEACGGTWHYLIRDDQSLPEGAPYCPAVAPPEQQTSGEEAAETAEEEAL
jgi:hypothetical protein